MSGCRKLTKDELSSISNSFERQRDRTLFTIAKYSGWRISQLLSIKVGHFMTNGKMSDYITIERAYVKGKTKSQSTPMLTEMREEIQKLLKEQYGDNVTPDLYLFKSREGKNKPISRITAHLALKNSVKSLEITGKVATHSFRKTFGDYIYKKSGHNLLLTQRALNHENISSTIHYLDVNKEEVDNLIKGME